ncbi:MAG: tetratricopeptide repeat protein [Chryseolinea sp.]
MRIEWMEKYMADAEKLIYENQVTEGLALLDNLLYDEPGYGSLHNHIGWAYLYYTVDIEKAELHLKMAIRFDATFAAPYLHIGNLYIRTGRYADALQYLEKGVVAMNPNKVAFMESIARAYELKKEYAKAVTAYKDALAITVGIESEKFAEGIKRCRKKRWVMMFTL